MATIHNFEQLIEESRVYCNDIVLGGKDGVDPLETYFQNHTGGLRLEENSPPPSVVEPLLRSKWASASGSSTTLISQPATSALTIGTA